MPSSGDLPDSGIEPASLMSPALAGGFFTTSATWEAHDDSGSLQNGELGQWLEQHRETLRDRKWEPPLGGASIHLWHPRYYYQGKAGRCVCVCVCVCVCCVSCSVVPDSLQLHGLKPSGLIYPWNFPGKNTGVDSHSLLQGIFQTQG